VNLRLLLALGATFAPSAALATPTACIFPFKGKTGPSVQKEVANRVCAAATCVEKSRAGKADFTVQGNVTQAGKKHLVTLEVTPRGKKKPAWRKTWGVSSDGKQLSDPDKALGALLGAMGLKEGSGQQTPAPAAEAGQQELKRPTRALVPLDLGGGEAPAAPAPSAAAPAGAAAPSAPEAWTRPSAAASSPPSAEVTARPRGHAPWVVVQAGTDVLTRNFSYSDLQIANLRGFRALAIVMPSLQLQLRPFAGGNAWLARLQLEGGVATSVGLRASISSRDVTWPASVLRVDGGLRAELLAPEVTGPGLALVAGYRLQSFSSGKAKDGTLLEGLAGTGYSALRAGAAGSWSFGAVTARAEFAALPLLGTGELQATYFPQTSGFGLEGMAGVDVALLPWLSLRLAGQATWFGTTFTTTETDPYIARGASDLYAGATTALRAGF